MKRKGHVSLPFGTVNEPCPTIQQVYLYPDTIHFLIGALQSLPLLRWSLCVKSIAPCWKV